MSTTIIIKNKKESTDLVAQVNKLLIKYNMNKMKLISTHTNLNTVTLLANGMEYCISKTKEGYSVAWNTPLNVITWRDYEYKYEAMYDIENCIKYHNFLYGKL